MKIHSIRIVDFRGIEDKTFEFDPQFNVLIGENGSGKTTVLEALAVAISPYVTVGLGARNIRLIKKEDVRVVSFEYSIEEKLRTAVSVIGELDGKNLEWTIGKPQFHWGYMKGDDTSVRKIASNHRELLAENGGSKVILPVFDYLGCGRLFSEPSAKLSTLPKGSRYEGYYQCLESSSSIKRFASWFKTMELAQLQGNPTARWRAEVVRRAVANCLDGWNSILFGVEEDQLMARRDSGELLPFSYLSDGQRNIAGMVADIAYRCVLLNPHLELEATQLTPGIVLIDELDLHLHPNWQRTIVQKLKETFPQIQFITTSHSPFIVQSLKKEELIPLDDLVNVDTDPFRKSIEEGAERYMQVHDVERSELFLQMEETAAEYFDLIEQEGDQGKIAELEEKLTELELRYADDPAYVALMKAERKTK